MIYKKFGICSQSRNSVWHKIYLRLFSNNQANLPVTAITMPLQDNRMRAGYQTVTTFFETLANGMALWQKAIDRQSKNDLEKVSGWRETRAIFARWGLGESLSDSINGWSATTATSLKILVIKSLLD